VTNPTDALEKFEAGVELARGADRRMRMAVVARVDSIDYIFQNVARNRGVAVAVFRSESAALQWLHKKSNRQPRPTSMNRHPGKEVS
jgi:hypothetical protein